MVTEPRRLRAVSRPPEPGLPGVSPQYAAHQQKDILVASNVFLIMYFTLFSLHFDCTPQTPPLYLESFPSCARRFLFCFLLEASASICESSLPIVPLWSCCFCGDFFCHSSLSTLLSSCFFHVLIPLLRL